MTQQKQIQISLPAVGEQEWQATRESFLSGWLTQGPKVRAFEQAFAKRHSAHYALATTSCTTGLHLVLAAAGIGPGDEVIVPAFTWVATANVVRYVGAKPVFVDVEKHTYNIDPEKIADVITENTKAIIAVHLFGLCANMDQIRKVIPSNTLILEDAACAAGARYKGVSAGVLGDAAVFSLHPRKSITTGEGGMVTCQSKELFEKMDALRNHGASISEEQRHNGPQPYLLPEFNLLGFNYRMTDLQGSVGLVQLEKLDHFIEERAHWANFYINALQEHNWLLPPTIPEGSEHSWQAFVCRVDPEKAPLPRNELMKQLFNQGISTRPGTHAVHNLGIYQKTLGTKPSDFPVADEMEKQTIALPLHNRMDAADYERVIAAIEAACCSHKL